MELIGVSSMNENWCALCLAILKPVTIDEALLKIVGLEELNQKSRRGLSKEEKKLADEEILNLRKAKLSWKEIAEKLGLTKAQVRNRYRRYSEKYLKGCEAIDCVKEKKAISNPPVN